MSRKSPKHIPFEIQPIMFPKDRPSDLAQLALCVSLRQASPAIMNDSLTGSVFFTDTIPLFMLLPAYCRHFGLAARSRACGIRGEGRPQSVLFSLHDRLHLLHASSLSPTSLVAFLAHLRIGAKHNEELVSCCSWLRWGPGLHFSLL